MRDEQEIRFGLFRFDPVALLLWKDEQVVAVQPKPLAVLRALATRSGQVVTKQALLKEVWAGTYVTQAVLKVAVRALREALGENADASQYVETVGREGYRFIAPPPLIPLGLGFRGQGTGLPSSPIPEPRSPNPLIVGRDAELTQLHNLLDKALRGEPQFVFVTGELGIGKTTLVEAFRQRLEIGDWRLALSSQVSSPKPPASLLIGHGQCIEQYGQGEPYLPVLEALGRLCREEDGQQLIPLLRKHAPTWLVQLPGVIEEGEMQVLRLQVQGATQQRMLREIAEAIEVGTVRRPVVLILEDLHWSDHATLEFLAYLGKRRQRMRLLVVATYRPIDVIMSGHPLKTVKQELQTHGQCEELRLELLSKQHVQTYVTERFGADSHLAEVAAQIHRRTEGNALFMVNVMEDLLTQGRIVQEQGQWTLTGEVPQLETPENLQQLIGRQFERLSEEAQRVLEVASVAGTEFVVATVAAGLRQDLEVVEEICEELAWQGRFLAEQGVAEWPDGTISGRYGFRHALYQNVLYERIAEVRRVRLHRLIGERLEQGYRDRAQEIAAELAVHFEQGRDYQRAVQYLEQAGKNAIRRSANVEAINHLTKGLELLKTLPDIPERAQQEFRLQLSLGGPMTAIKGWGAPETGAVYARARELCQQVEETPQIFPVLWGLCAFYSVRAEYQTAFELAKQLLSLAERVQDSALLLEAHYAVGQALYFMGEFPGGREHLEQAIALYEVRQHRSLAFVHGMDPGVMGRSMAALALWFLGYPEQALRYSRDALTLARELSHPFSLAFALLNAASLHHYRREGQIMQEWAEATVNLSTEQGFPYFAAVGTAMWGAALTAQDQSEAGIEQIRQGLSIQQRGGAAVGRPTYLGMLATAYGKVGQVEEGLNVLTEALAAADRSSGRASEAELYRLKGELTLQSKVSLGQVLGKSKISRRQVTDKSRPSQNKSGTNPRPLTPDLQSEAEAYFLKAIEIAQRQQAKSLELRATMSLARLWQQQGKRKEAHEMLAEIYNWFTEGFDTKDLQEAKALLDGLESGV